MKLLSAFFLGMKGILSFFWVDLIDSLQHFTLILFASTRYKAFEYFPHDSCCVNYALPAMKLFLVLGKWRKSYNSRK